MDLSVHQAMLAIALRKAHEELGDGIDLRCFKALWMGNMLTDINQGTAFFDAVSGTRPNPYDTGGVYKAAPSLEEVREPWTNLIHAVWDQDWKRTEEAARDHDSLLRGFNNPDPLINPGTLEQIGGYNPLDHFDVVDGFDAQGNLVQGESDEFAKQEIPLFSRTAYFGVYQHADSYLSSFFNSINSPGDLKSRNDPDALRYIGKALHTLQDFFSHSNYVELLLLLAAQQITPVKERLAPVLSRASRDELGYLYYPVTDRNQKIEELLAQTPVVTGRFDRTDTLWTLLGILRNHLMPEQNDLWQTGMSPPKDGDAHHKVAFHILFGTFSENTTIGRSMRTLAWLDSAKHAMEKVTDFLRQGVIRVCTTVARQFFQREDDKNTLINDLATLLGASNGSELNRYLEVGRLDFARAQIVRGLRVQDLEISSDSSLDEKRQRYQNELRLLLPSLGQTADPQTKVKDFLNRAGKGLSIEPRVLPHHTLLAKDHDTGQPEQRLLYKIACCLATDVTKELLVHYFRGSNYGDVRATLNKYYQHPARFLEIPGNRERVIQWVDQLYGVRWYRSYDQN